MKSANLFQSKITGGFFYKKQKNNSDITIPRVYERFLDTGRFEAIKCKKSDKPIPLVWESDVAKWLEGVIYYLSQEENDDIRKIYDGAVEDIVNNQLECGYYNPHFQVEEPENIFKRRYDHELYSAGHIFEAAVAASQYLNDDRLLSFSEKYVDYIIDRFMVKKDTGFTTPGHEEIELALLKLYELTKKEKYLKLASFFLDERGKRKEDEYAPDVYNYSQSSFPVRKQHTAEGHAVRALYLYTAMAEMAKVSGDKKLKKAVEDIFNDIVDKKQYITGGVGSAHEGERFTYQYDLPNFLGFCETCSSIAMGFFSGKMLELTGEAKYGDAFEKVLYNSILSGITLNGEDFFYVNPLEMDVDKVHYVQKVPWKMNVPITQRVKLFECSCCPPNICRFFAELPQYIYYEGENELVISQHITSTYDGELATINMESNLPYSGKVKITVNSHGKNIKLKIRVPYWSSGDLKATENGYAVFEGIFDNQIISFDLGLYLQQVYANPLVKEDNGKVAFTYGPLTLCAEGKDNPFNLFAVTIPTNISPIIEMRYDDYILNVKIPCEVFKTFKGLYSYRRPSKSKAILTLIPYHAWANRGENDMKVWFNKK